MKHLALILILLSIVPLLFLLTQCTNSQPQPAAPSEQQMIARGEYIVTTGLCHDCHSPKIFHADGSFEPDMTKPLSGHPAEAKLPPIDTSEIRPGKWYLGAADLTAWVGPWGISYPINLTPDSTTGIGAWTVGSPGTELEFAL